MDANMDRKGVGWKYRDAATILTLPILLPYMSWKRQGRLVTNKSQALGQANKALYLRSAEVEA